MNLRYHPVIPPYLKRRIEDRINVLPPTVGIDYARAIAAEWHTDDMVCAVICLDTGELALEMQPRQK